MYTYPDANDLLTIELINKEFDGEYWGKSEENLFPTIVEAVEGVAGERNMLDLGCGMGRLFPYFAPYMQNIQALEPDVERYAEAVKAAEVFDGKIDEVNLLEQ